MLLPFPVQGDRGGQVAFDLFCGAGGASLGLQAAGYEVIGFEVDATACGTHERNGLTTVRADLDGFDWTGYESPALLWASCPCQPFSASGGHLGIEDFRDGVPAFIHAIRQLLPPLVMFENVEGLTYAKHAAYLEAILSAVRGLGYEVAWRVLDCSSYGVPQVRRRLLLVARNDGRPICWPEPTHGDPGSGLLPRVAMADALGWEGGGRVGFPRQDDRGTSPDGYRERDWYDVDGPAPTVTGKARSWLLNTGRDWKPGEGRDAAQTIDPYEQPAPTLTGGNRRMYDIEEPAPTLVFGHDAAAWAWTRPATTVMGTDGVWPPGHKVNADDRRRLGDEEANARYGGRAQSLKVPLTVAEAATLQDFPPGFRFAGSRSRQFEQIGNAVPSRIARFLAEANQ